MHRAFVCAAAIVVLIAGAHAAAGDQPVVVRQTDTAVVAGNGIVSITIGKKTAEITSMTYQPDEGARPIELGDKGPRAVYWDVNAAPEKIPAGREKARPKGDYTRAFQCLNSLGIARADAGMADVVADVGPSEWFPFHAQLHYVVRRGISGFYTYVLFHHEKGMPAAMLEQTRIAIRAEHHGAIFTDQFVDDARAGPPPSSKIVSILQDATYRLADGAAYTKYDNTQFVKDFSAYGMVGHHVGLWLVWPSTEFCNGGPLKQELTVQIDNIMQAMFQGEHFGAAPVRVADDEVWDKCYGPVLVYMNHGGSDDNLWRSAQRQARQQQEEWPFKWVEDSDYPLRRGAVEGRIMLHNAVDAGVGGAWAILASDAPGEEKVDWAVRSKGYEFWTHVDAQGHFRIGGVRPGKYTLFISGADQFEPLQKPGITVAADQTTPLGDLQWEAVTHGRRLWQIGRVDRSTAEFHDGAEPAYRNFDTFLKYFKSFPQDVTFTIGESKESQDWEYAQWSWYNEKPFWTIRFSLDAASIPAKGTATLTLGIASGQPAGGVLVGVNGQNVATLTVAKTGTAGYRSGAQDSVYTVKTVSFDAVLLKPGNNEITLGQSGMQKFSPDLLAKQHRPPRDIMYDAIRLEVAGQGNPKPSSEQ